MIAFNGGKAAAIGRRQLPVPEGMAFIDLPSSSTAHTFGFDAKLERWLKLRGALVVPYGSPHPFVLSLSKPSPSSCVAKRKQGPSPRSAAPAKGAGTHLPHPTPYTPQ